MRFSVSGLFLQGGLEHFCACACITICVWWKVSEEILPSSGFGRVSLEVVVLEKSCCQLLDSFVCIRSTAKTALGCVRFGRMAQDENENDRLACTDCLTCGQYPLSLPSFSHESFNIWIVTSTSKSDSPLFS